MALKNYSTIVDDIQDYLGSNATDFTDALMLKWVPQGLSELSGYCPHIVREIFPTTSTSKELDISEIKDLLWIDALEYKVGQSTRQWRNFTRHYGTVISMEIEATPQDADTGIDTDEALTAGETTIDCDADATDDIPVGTIIRIESELYYVTGTGTTLTVVAGYGRSTQTTHTTNQDIYIPELAYLYCAKTHKLPAVATIVGAATANYTAGVLTINVDGLTSTGTIEAGTTFTIASDGTTTHYTLLDDTVLSGGAGNFVFTPALAEDILENVVVSCDNSTMTPALETLLIDLVAARCALSISTKFIQGIPQSGRNPFRDYMTWWQQQLGITLQKLQNESLKYRKPHAILPRS